MLVRTASRTVFRGALDRQVDGASAVEGEAETSLVRGDQREDDMADIASGQVMGLQLIRIDVQPRFASGDPVVRPSTRREPGEATWPPD